MANEERLPGLTLHLDKATLKGGSGVIALRASVNDEAVWESVISRIDGHRIYAAENLAQAALDLLQEDVRGRDAELHALRQELHEKTERLSAENSMLKYEQAEWAAAVRSLEADLGEALDRARLATDSANQWKDYAEQLKALMEKGQRVPP